MNICLVINEIVEIVFVLFGLVYLSGRSNKIIKEKVFLISSIIMILICLVLNVGLFDYPELYYLIRTIIIVAYAFGVYNKIFVDTFFKVFILLLLIDIINFVLALCTYPIAIIFQLETNTLITELVALIPDVVVYLILIYMFAKRRPSYIWCIIGNVKKGIFVICFVVELVFIGFKTFDFNQDNITIYLLWIAFIVFGITILILWLRDRKKQHDKFAELIKYEHRTREIIPAIEKALQDLKNMGLSKTEEQRMIAELEAICKSSRSSARGKDQRVRSFETTGSPILDNQLEQFVEECEQNGILLDVIVRAEIVAFMDLEDVEILTVLQIVGDLYRNAFKAVSQNKEKKNLLICFGYNADDYYEIGIYDNGHPFPPHIKEQLGVRGVTVEGTGHGMADVFEHLHHHHASFVLEENPAEGITFTKGIHIVFDEKDRIEI